MVALGLICSVVVAQSSFVGAQNEEGGSQQLSEVLLRDELIGDQESLLNVYRCLFNIDTQIVPGGCADRKPAQAKPDPQPFSGTPTLRDIEVRDELVADQESLLNVYRCLFNIDTHAVPGGCTDGKPAESKPELTATPQPTATTTPDPELPTVSARFVLPSYTAAEGTTAQISVHLDYSAPGRTVTIPLTSSFGGGATESDFGPLPTSITFGPTETTKTIDIAIIDDKLSDPGESLTLAIGQPLPNGVLQGVTPQITIDITDTGVTPVTVRFATSTATVSEGSLAQLRLTLDRAPGRTLTIPLTYAFHGGATESDLGRLGYVDTTIDFGPNTTSIVVGPMVVDDGLVDPGESFTAAIGRNLPERVTAGIPSQVTVNIDDAGVTPIKMGFNSPSATASEGSTLLLPLGLYRDPDKVVTAGRTVEIPLEYSFHGGASAADLGTQPTSVTFGPSDTNKSIAIEIVDDGLVDPGESFTISIGQTLPDGFAHGTPIQVTVQITDSGVPAVEVSFGQSTYTAAEGTTAQVTVELDRAPNRAVTIPLTTAFQSGASAADFGTLPTSVKFEASEIAKTVSFAVVDDQQGDSGESITLAIGSNLPDRVTAGTPNQATVNITDTGVPEVKVTFGSATYTAAEGTTAQIAVELDKTPNRTVVIPLTYTFGGGATAADFGTRPAFATFAANETAQIISITVVDDQLGDPGESIKVAFGTNLPTKVIVGRPNQTTVNITDTGVPRVEVGFGSATYSVTEGTTAQVAVQLSRTPNREVTIPLTYTFGAGASTADFGTRPASVTFAANQTSQTISFTVTDDQQGDPGESITLAIGSNLPTRVTAGTPNQTTVNITDTGVPAISIRFRTPDHTVTEGFTAYVRLSRGQPWDDSLTIPLTYSFGGSATAADFGTLPASATFAAGSFTATVAIPLTDDDLDDTGESIQVSIGTTLPEGFEAGSPNQVTINISDADPKQLQVQFATVASSTVTEGSYASTVICLDDDPWREVRLSYTYSFEGGATVDDIGERDLSQTFAAWSDCYPVVVWINSDDLDESGESIVVSVKQPLPDGVTLGTVAQVTFHIIDAP